MIGAVVSSTVITKVSFTSVSPSTAVSGFCAVSSVRQLTVVESESNDTIGNVCAAAGEAVAVAHISTPSKPASTPAAASWSSAVFFRHAATWLGLHSRPHWSRPRVTMTCSSPPSVCLVSYGV